MNLLLDYPACERLAWLVSLSVGTELRHYYALDPTDAKLAMVVARGAKLEAMAGMVVDATLGWDDGYPGFVYYPGKLHSKVTIFGRTEAAHERTLSDILSNAPDRRKE